MASFKPEVKAAGLNDRKLDVQICYTVTQVCFTIIFLIL